MRMLLWSWCVLVLAACGGPTGTDPADPVDPADPPEQDGASVETVPASLPALEPGQYELHGRFGDERFWLRLTPMDATYGGRVLQVVYTPPEREALGGTLLDPHPWLLMDEAFRLLVWNERSRLSRAQYRDDTDPAGYRVTREIERVIGDDRFSDEEQRDVSGPIGWERRTAPLLLALVWRPDTSGRVTTYDLFAAEGGAGVLEWEGATLTLDGRQWRVIGDGNGRVASIRDGDEVLVAVEEHLPILPADEARARNEAFMRDLLGD